MKTLLKILSLMAVWGAVAYTVIYIDPETIKDVGIEGLYLPFLITTLFALWYSLLVVYRSFWLGVIVAALMGLGLVLSILQYVSVFTWVIILLLIMFSIYLFKRDNSAYKSEKRVK